MPMFHVWHREEPAFCVGNNLPLLSLESIHFSCYSERTLWLEPCVGYTMEGAQGFFSLQKGQGQVGVLAFGISTLEAEESGSL